MALTTISLAASQLRMSACTSLKRASSAASGMPRCANASRMWGPGVMMHRLMVPPSEVLKFPMNGLLFAAPDFGILLRMTLPLSMN